MKDEQTENFINSFLLETRKEQHKIIMYLKNKLADLQHEYEEIKHQQHQSLIDDVTYNDTKEEIWWRMKNIEENIEMRQALITFLRPTKSYISFASFEV